MASKRGPLDEFDDGPEAGSLRRPSRRPSRRSSRGFETVLETGSGRRSEESSRRRLDGLGPATVLFGGPEEGPKVSRRP